MAENNKSVKETEKSNRIKSIIAVCVCVIIAFGMWVYVMTVESPEHEQVFSGVTVELTGTDSLAENELAIFSGYGVKLDVTLAGKKSVVSKLSADDIIVTADMSSVTSSGRYSIKASVDVPAGCKLIGLSQNTISVYVDRASQIVVDLTEKRENTNLPEGCFTGTIDLSVDKVTVSGPVSVLGKISGAVVTLDMSNITKTSSVTRKIALVDTAGAPIDNPYIDYYPNEITVDIPILKTMRVPLEVEFKNGFLSYDSTNIVIDPEFVEVTGDAELMKNGDSVKPIVVDEVMSLEGGSYSSVVSLEAADGLELSQQKAKVSIELKSNYSSRKYTVSEENIYAIGAKDGVEFTWRSVPMTVEMIGRDDILDKITDAQIGLAFDMSPYSSSNSGTVRVKADVVMNSEYAQEVLPVGTYYISVTFGKNE